jgi:5-methyltetrahydrofolate--homocysteine methyltransferase
VIHVLDASRSVAVAGSLLSKEQKPGFLQQVKTEYEKLRVEFESKKTSKEYLRFSEAVANKAKLNWSEYQPVAPSFTGTRVFRNYDLAEIADYIDWSPFFIAWEMGGRFPDLLKDAVIGVEATRLYEDARKLLQQIIQEKWLDAHGVIGFWPANSNGADTVSLLHEQKGPDEVVHLEFLRQQVKKAAGQPNLSLADFIAPADAAVQDYIGAFAVTIAGIEPHIKAFEAAHDDYNKIMLQALADRLAEAFAECLHARVRKEFWGYAHDESLSNEDLIRESYQGIRPAPGYPACPDHTEKYKLFELLEAQQATGIQLTESLAMYPAASVCGWYIAHPDSKYFGVGKIGQDQLKDYASRKKMDLPTMEKWLRPALD